MILLVRIRFPCQQRILGRMTVDALLAISFLVSNAFYAATSIVQLANSAHEPTVIHVLDVYGACAGGLGSVFGYAWLEDVLSWHES